MNNAKRVLTFALAVCSLSAFASCGSSSDSSSKVVDKKLKEDQQQIVQRLAAVSYTHLTLPTNSRV